MIGELNCFSRSWIFPSAIFPANSREKISSCLNFSARGILTYCMDLLLKGENKTVHQPLEKGNFPKSTFTGATIENIVRDPKKDFFPKRKLLPIMGN
jgi:hypothetical protein